MLDTWFSSGLWPFSTLGWPAATPDLDRCASLGGRSALLLGVHCCLPVQAATTPDQEERCVMCG